MHTRGHDHIKHIVSEYTRNYVVSLVFRLDRKCLLHFGFLCLMDCANCCAIWKGGGSGLQELRRNLYVFVKSVVLVLVTREYVAILGTTIISGAFLLFVR